MPLLGEEIEVTQAAEPTDIIWENREYSPNSRIWKTVVAWIVIFIMLGFSFIGIFEMSVFGNKAMEYFPQNLDCPATQKQWYKLQTQEKNMNLW
jgi:hypothetical protein